MSVSNIIFVIGVNGVGKSSVIPVLKRSLEQESFEIHDFDERGVPDHADKEWRYQETLHWMEVGKTNMSNHKSTIICGFSKPVEIAKAGSVCGVEPKIILLDANSNAITQRIMSRYITPESIAELLRTTGKTPEKFVQDNVWIASKFRQECSDLGCSIIDTTTLTPEKVSATITSLIN